MCDEISLHYVIVQADAVGLQGWTLDHGSRGHRWDALLDTMLQCFSIDGRWSSSIDVTTLVGKDVIHLDHHLQDSIMPVVGVKRNGKARRAPATLEQFQNVIWGLQHSNAHSGIEFSRTSAYHPSKRKKTILW